MESQPHTLQQIDAPASSLEALGRHYVARIFATGKAGQLFREPTTDTQILSASQLHEAFLSSAACHLPYRSMVLAAMPCASESWQAS